MTTERDVNKLLSVILEKSRFVTGADAGIYVVEGDEKRPMLRFKLTQNDSVMFDSREFVMPISNCLIAGAAALLVPINIANVYELPPGSPYSVDKSFDEKIGYVTRSMLAIPLVSQRDEVIGVIQLINKKSDPSRKLAGKADVEATVIPFDQRSEELLGMLAAQAAVSLENAMLYDEIHKLFEGFVRRERGKRIESRDPTTSGLLAPRRRSHRRPRQDRRRSLRGQLLRRCSAARTSASLSTRALHDFGKIGVRGEGARQSQEALRAARHHSRALRLRHPPARGRDPLPQGARAGARRAAA
ncbi:MAG: GAF domain-containing protein [Polyangiaceae bacterium]